MTDLRAQLVEHGLEQHADALLGQASPSVRLPTVAGPENKAGQLGDGTRQMRRAPVQALAGGAVAIAGGYRSSLALLDDGAVLAWGESVVPGYQGTEKPALIPMAVEGLRDITAVAAGEYHWLALAAGGRMLGWGFNVRGEVGDGTRDRRQTPVAVDGLKHVTAIAAGWGQSLALTADGRVHAWGDSGLGAVGSHHRGAQLVPLEVPALADATTIAAGRQVSLALTARGAFAWGFNFEGQLADPSDPAADAIRTVPVAVAGAGNDIVAVAPRVALRADGAVLSWGGEIDEQPADDDDLPVGRSKLGGSPDLPVDATWPSFDDRPMAFIAQLALADLAPHDEQRLLPADGLLSVFWSTSDHEAPGSVHVVYTEATAALSRLDPPAGLPERFTAVELHPTPELTLPPADWPSLEALGLSESERLTYRNEIVESAEPPLHRTLGHPDIIQNDPRVGDMRLLLQVDTDHAAGMDWGEGRLYLWIEADDLAARAFDRVWLEYQQT